MLVNIVAPFRMLLRFAIAINIIGNNFIHFESSDFIFECFRQKKINEHIYIRTFSNAFD